MAMGLPVVASDIPPCRDAVVHGENGFVARNEEELFNYSLELADDPALRHRFAEASRRRARLFSLEKTLAALEALYLDTPPPEAPENPIGPPKKVHFLLFKGEWLW